jgi:hypothetical protein
MEILRGGFVHQKRGCRMSPNLKQYLTNARKRYSGAAKRQQDLQQMSPGPSLLSDWVAGLREVEPPRFPQRRPWRKAIDPSRCLLDTLSAKAGAWRDYAMAVAVEETRWACWGGRRACYGDDVGGWWVAADAEVMGGGVMLFFDGSVNGKHNAGPAREGMNVLRPGRWKERGGWGDGV